MNIHRSFLSLGVGIKAAMVSLPNKGQSGVEGVARMRRVLAQVKKKRDFLRDAALFFAWESPGGTR